MGSCDRCRIFPLTGDWTSFSHAYGPAGDIPALLEALARARSAKGRAGAWEEFWSSLCHQGTVYAATYAALPHIVAIGVALGTNAEVTFWAFAGAVAVSRDRAPMPRELEGAYTHAVRAAEEQTILALRLASKPGPAVTLATALAGLRGLTNLEFALSCLSDEEIAPLCTTCEAEFFIPVIETPFVAWADDPGKRKATAKTATRPRVPRPDVAAVTAAVPAKLASVRDRVLALDADVTCPHCGAEASLLDDVVGALVRTG